MNAINIISLAVGFIGLAATIASLAYALKGARQLTKGVKYSTLRQIRTMIGRMEEEKERCPKDSSAWSAMHHTQQDLDATFKSLQAMFGISDKDAPHV